MIKHIFLIVGSVILFSIHCSAQKNGCASLSYGLSFAVADFGSIDTNNSKAGIASTGTVLDLSYSYKLSKIFGIIASYRYQTNRVQTEVMAQNLSNRVNVPVSVTATDWTYTGPLFGACAFIPIDRKFAFELRAMVGFFNVSSPETIVQTSTVPRSVSVKQNSVTARSFAYEFGIGVTMNMGERFCLLTKAGYAGSKPTFNQVITTSNAGLSLSTNFSQIIQAVTISLGVGFRID